jgi:hypothetical protein
VAEVLAGAEASADVISLCVCELMALAQSSWFSVATMAEGLVEFAVRDDRLRTMVVEEGLVGV